MLTAISLGLRAALGVVGLALVIGGLSFIRDWRKIGSAHASIWAMSSYLLGRRALARDWNRRDQVKRWHGVSMIVMGLVVAALALFARS